MEEKVRSKEEKFLQREINIKTKVQQDNQTEKILSMGGTELELAVVFLIGKLVSSRIEMYSFVTEVLMDCCNQVW